eukprot:scpid97202/ scgid14887/ 
MVVSTYTFGRDAGFTTGTIGVAGADEEPAVSGALWGDNEAGDFLGVVGVLPDLPRPALRDFNDSVNLCDLLVDGELFGLGDNTLASGLTGETGTCITAGDDVLRASFEGDAKVVPRFWDGFGDGSGDRFWDGFGDECAVAANAGKVYGTAAGDDVAFDGLPRGSDEGWCNRLVDSEAL